MRSQNAVLRCPFPTIGSCEMCRKLQHRSLSSSALKFLPFLVFHASPLAILALTAFGVSDGALGKTGKTWLYRERASEYREQENVVTFAGCVEEPTTNYPLSLPLQGAVTGCVEDAFTVLQMFRHSFVPMLI